MDNRKYLTEVFFNRERLLVDDLGQGEYIRIPVHTMDEDFNKFIMDVYYLKKLFEDIGDDIEVKMNIDKMTINYIITRDIKYVRLKKLNEIL